MYNTFKVTTVHMGVPMLFPIYILLLLLLLYIGYVISDHLIGFNNQVEFVYFQIKWI